MFKSKKASIIVGLCMVFVLILGTTALAPPKNAKKTYPISKSAADVVIQTEKWSPTVTFVRGGLGVVSSAYKKAGWSTPGNLVIDVYDYQSGNLLQTVSSNKTTFKVSLGKNSSYRLNIHYETADQSVNDWSWRISTMSNCFIIGMDGTPINYNN